MGTVFKKFVTRPMPEGAEIVERKGEKLARFRGRDGKMTSAPLAKAGGRIKVEAATFVAKYRDGEGVVREVRTGCRSEDAARHVLARLEREAELVRAGVMSPAESRMADHLQAPIGEHIDAYLESMEAAGTVELHRRNVRTYLGRVAEVCGIKRLGDVRREAVESWLTREARSGRSARSRNAHLAAWNAFCNWGCDPSIGRLPSNPLRGVPKANEKADPRRKRRALTEDELRRLIDAARRRPIEGAMMMRRGPNKGLLVREVAPEDRERLEMLGRVDKFWARHAD